MGRDPVAELVHPIQQGHQEFLLSLFVPKGSNPVLEILSGSGIDVHRPAGGEDRQREKCQIEQKKSEGEKQ